MNRTQTRAQRSAANRAAFRAKAAAARKATFTRRRNPAELFGWGLESQKAARHAEPRQATAAIRRIGPFVVESERSVFDPVAKRAATGYGVVRPTDGLIGFLHPHGDRFKFHEQLDLFNPHDNVPQWVERQAPVTDVQAERARRASAQGSLFGNPARHVPRRNPDPAEVGERVRQAQADLTAAMGAAIVQPGNPEVQDAVQAAQKEFAKAHRELGDYMRGASFAQALAATTSRGGPSPGGAAPSSPSAKKKGERATVVLPQLALPSMVATAPVRATAPRHALLAAPPPRPAPRIPQHLPAAAFRPAPRAPANEAPLALPPPPAAPDDAAPDDFHVGALPMSLCIAAHNGTSHVPERRGEQEQDGYRSFLQGVWSRIEARCKTPAERAVALDAMERFKARFRAAKIAQLTAHSRIMSSMITGGARFPVDRMRKANAVEGKRLDELVDLENGGEAWVWKHVQDMRQKAALEAAGSHGNLYRQKAAAAQRMQANMVAANKVLRSKLSQGDKIAQLRAIGFSEKNAAELLLPDHFGRVGFHYQITNNNAEIKRLQARADEMDRRDARPTGDVVQTDSGVRVVDNAEVDRVQIVFPGRPDSATIAALKSHGFRWSPSNSAWQRQRTENALYYAKQIVKSVTAAEESLIRNPPLPQYSKRLGRGYASQAYGMEQPRASDPEAVEVLTSTNGPSYRQMVDACKEVLIAARAALAADREAIAYLPRLRPKRIDITSEWGGTTEFVYGMPQYQPLDDVSDRDLPAATLDDVVELRTSRLRAREVPRSDIEALRLSPPLHRAMLALWDAGRRFTVNDWLQFDIADRNLALDHRGHLILLDPLLVEVPLQDMLDHWQERALATAHRKQIHPDESKRRPGQLALALNPAIRNPDVLSGEIRATPAGFVVRSWEKKGGKRVKFEIPISDEVANLPDWRVDLATWPRKLKRSLPSERYRTAPAAATAAPALAPMFYHGPGGATMSRAAMPGGGSIECEWRVVDLSQLRTSHDPWQLTPSPGYPQELQPRDRSRASYGDQIRRLVVDFDPSQMMVANDVSGGSPIIGPDGVVESGNGRAMTLARVYRDEPSKAAAYEALARQWAAHMGLVWPEHVAQPVLVRLRITDVDRAAFARDANVSTGQQMAAAEIAKADAAKLSPAIMALLAPHSGLDTRANAGFVEAFVTDVAGAQARGDLLDSHGQLSQRGEDRIRIALFAKAYGDGAKSFVEAAAEETDSDYKTMLNGLMAAAPAWAAFRFDCARGRFPSRYDITPAVLAMAEIVKAAKDSKTGIDRVRLTGKLFGGTEQEASLLALAAHPRTKDNANAGSAAALAATLRDYMGRVESQSAGEQNAMFAAPGESPLDLLRRAVIRTVLDEAASNRTPPALAAEAVRMAGRFGDEQGLRLWPPEWRDALVTGRHMVDTGHVYGIDRKGVRRWCTRDELRNRTADDDDDDDKEQNPRRRNPLAWALGHAATAAAKALFKKRNPGKPARNPAPAVAIPAALPVGHNVRRNGHIFRNLGNGYVVVDGVRCKTGSGRK